MSGDYPLADQIAAFHLYGKAVSKDKMHAEALRLIGGLEMQRAELLAALESLVQVIEWQAENNFLNEDAEENENPLTVARAAVAKAKGGKS